MNLLKLNNFSLLFLRPATGRRFCLGIASCVMFLFLSLFFGYSAFSGESRQEEVVWHLLYTGGVFGETEPCG